MDMVKRYKKSPKLRAKGAETRHLVPYALHLAEELNNEVKSVKTQTILIAASNMFSFYCCMGMMPYPQAAAAESCRNFLLAFNALAKMAVKEGKLAWVAKPKSHLFQELAEFQSVVLGDPSKFWNYKDEDFMGIVAKMAMRRGGASNATVTARQTMERYRLSLSKPVLD